MGIYIYFKQIKFYSQVFGAINLFFNLFIIAHSVFVLSLKWKKYLYRLQ